MGVGGFYAPTQRYVVVIVIVIASGARLEHALIGLVSLDCWLACHAVYSYGRLAGVLCLCSDYAVLCFDCAVTVL